MGRTYSLTMLSLFSEMKIFKQRPIQVHPVTIQAHLELQEINTR